MHTAPPLLPLSQGTTFLQPLQCKMTAAPVCDLWRCLPIPFVRLLTISPMLRLTISESSLSFLLTLGRSAAERRKNCLVARCLGREPGPLPSMHCRKSLPTRALHPLDFSAMCLDPASRLALLGILRQAFCIRMHRLGDLLRQQSPLSGQSFVGWQLPSDARGSVEVSLSAVPPRI